MQEAAGESSQSTLADLDADLQALAEPLEESRKRANELQKGEFFLQISPPSSRFPSIRDSDPSSRLVSPSAAEVNALKSTPTTDELAVQIEGLQKKVRALSPFSPSYSLPGFPLLLFSRSRPVEVISFPFARRTPSTSPTSSPSEPARNPSHPRTSRPPTPSGPRSEPSGSRGGRCTMGEDASTSFSFRFARGREDGIL